VKIVDLRADPVVEREKENVSLENRIKTQGRLTIFKNIVT
jgi:hypothetical protein